MKKLLIATNNKGKVKELHDLLKGLNVQLVTPADINLNLEVEEDGNTYIANSTKKAIAFARASGLLSLADDSGLEVDALDGAPGLHSARYAPPSPPHFQGKWGGRGGLTDVDRRAYMLENLNGKPRPWTAHFHATIAIAHPSTTLPSTTLPSTSLPSTSLPSTSLPSTSLPSTSLRAEDVSIAEGACYGEIIPEERGTNGFGYDPIFFFPELNKTMAELDMETKNRLSHRAKAVMNAIPILKGWL